MHVPGQARFAFKPLPEIENAQRKRLRRAVAHAYGTVPYYQETMRRLGLSPADFHTARDLSKLPVIEREDLQRDPEYFVSRAEPVEHCLSLRTAGSAGAPRQVFRDTAAVVESGAHLERPRAVMREVGRMGLRYREAVISSTFSVTEATREFFQERTLIPSDLLLPHRYLSLLDSPERNLSLLNEFRPDVVESFGSYLELLFPYIHASGRPFHRPKVVVYGSDAMSDSARRLISQTMGIPVLSAYGAIEAFHIGFECELGVGYHLNVDLVPLRVVDPEGRDLPAGESGEVIVSDLVNRATVLLNYRLGDIASTLPFECPCGRSLPLLSFIEGRIDDWVRSASGEVVHPQAVRSLFTEEEEIWQYQAVQVAPSHFEAAVVVRDGCEREALRERLAVKFARRLGEGTTVEVAFVDAIPRTPGGKVRAVRRVDAEQAGEAAPVRPVMP
jgi:phenylacetate-CoA ligase